MPCITERLSVPGESIQGGFGCAEPLGDLGHHERTGSRRDRSTGIDGLRLLLCDDFNSCHQLPSAECPLHDEPSLAMEQPAMAFSRSAFRGIRCDAKVALDAREIAACRLTALSAETLCNSL